jgi:putative DNA primase/helicase
LANSLDDVISQMAARGLHVPPSVDLRHAFTRYVRFRPEHDKRNKKSAWVRLFEFKAQSGRVYISGAYGNRNDKWEVEASDAGWTPADRQAHADARAAAAKLAAAERAQEAETAADKARRFGGRATRLEPGTICHPYLEKKRVGAYGVRIGFNDRLLVPLADVQGAVQGLQYISPLGEKLFGSGTAKEGKSHLLGELKEGVPLLAFGEGYATCASVHMAMGWPVVCCFDAGNLAPVVSEYRRLYPDLEFVVLADDDRFLLQRLSERLARHGIVCTPDELRLSMDRDWQIPDGPDVVLLAGWKGDAVGTMRIEGTLRVGDSEQAVLIENAGQAKAHAAAKKHRARVLTPFFADRESKHTDWNDLHCTVGLEGVAEQLRTAMDAPPEKPRANARAQRDDKGAGKGGKKTGPPPGREGDMPFVERFTLIYGTTTIWDAQTREIVRLEALKVAFGRSIDWWLAQEDRRMVMQDHVVFDPSGLCTGEGWVNLFDKLPLVPKPGKCDLIISHIYNLCGENDALFHWVLSWLAYPLQHPGAKMRTAIVLHGRTEGTGKSKLGEIMRRIYGRYCTSVGQAELQRDFNDWISAKLFVLCEEVVSRADRAHHQGMLQALITQPTVQVNTKNMPIREEANHANFMFYSNQQVPVLLNPTDRRYTVIKVEQVQAPGYFEALDAELAAGGAEAFYAYLLAYDCEGFNEYSKPFENKDRLHLITLGMSPDQRFIHFWTLGHAGVPFCCCAAGDLYVAFKAWCRTNGERFVPTQTSFGRTVSEMLERMGAPPKATKRYFGYSDKEISEGDFAGEPSARQGILYFVPAEKEVMRELVQGDERPVLPDPLPDCTQSVYFNARVKLFQPRLHELLSSARRSL